MPSDPFIDAAALPSLGPVRYLDARDQAAFDAGHAPGAVRVPLDAWDKAAKSADVGFGNAAYWSEALGSLGLDPSVTAVAYDSGAMTNAARVWFILQYFGLKCVILNGGWPRCPAASGFPAAAAPSPNGFQAKPGAGAVGVVDRETLKQQLDGAAHVFDSRTRAEFTGEDARNRPRGGTSARRAASVARRSDGQRRGASGAGPARHAGGRWVRPRRSYRDALRGRGTGGTGRGRGGARRLRRCPRLLSQLRRLGAR